MVRRSLLTFAASAAILLLLAIPGAAQDFLFSVDSLSFGDVPVGLKGIPDGNRTITITNNTGAAVDVWIGFTDLAFPEDFELMDPEVASIRKVLRDFYDAIGCYRQDHGEDPESEFDLAALGYLRIDEAILHEWNFEMIGRNPITQIWATRGETLILYDLQTARFRYSINDQWIDRIESYRFSAGERHEFTVNYSPSEAGAVSGWLTLITMESDTRLPISGTGFVKEALTLSTEAIEFGQVYLGRRVTRELTLSNISGDLINVEFDWSEASRFSLYKGYVKDVRNYILLIYGACVRFRGEHREDPTSVEELWELGYVPRNEVLERLWSFSLIGSNPVTQIEAVSTADLPRGAGHVVLFDVQANSFTGFGVLENGMVVGRDRRETIYAEFVPEQPGDDETVVNLQVWVGERGHQAQQYTLRLSGAGLGVADDGGALLPGGLSLTSAYPNPFNSSTFVSFSTSDRTPLRATLMDINGRKWTEWTVTPVELGQGRIAVDGAGLATGMYWLRLEQNGNVASRRLVLVR